MITRSVWFSLGFAAFIILSSLLLVTDFAVSLFGEDWPQRIAGSILGLAAVIYANAGAKRAPEDAGRDEKYPGEFRLRRRTALAITLGGVGYVLAWLFAPIDLAVYAAVIVMLIGLAIAAAITLIGSNARSS